MSSNYTTDVDYPTMFFHEQTPILMSTIARLVGFNHHFSAQDFTYCDFGCGKGFTLNLLAASNPEGTFYGVDINGSHIASAKEQAERAGLTNVTYIEANFDDLKPDDLPALNYAAVTGIYSWLPNDTRLRLIRYIEGRLVETGLFFLHYLAMPGVGGSMVTTKLTQLLAEENEGQSSVRVTNAVTELNDILSDNPNLLFNQDIPNARERLERQLKMEPNYLAHDILNRNHDDLWFHQVARDFASAGLDFLGQARARMNAYGDLYQPALANIYNDFCAKHGDPILRQEIIGLLNNTAVRMDVFGKKHIPIGAGEVGDFSNLYIFNAAGRDHLSSRTGLKQKVSVDFSQPIYGFILDRRAGSDNEADKVVRDSVQIYGVAKTRAALQHLIGMNLIAFGPRSSAAHADMAVFNPSPFDRIILKELMGNPGAVPLPSKVLGSCVQIARTERILLAALIEEDLNEIWNLIDQYQIKIAKGGGATVTSSAELGHIMPEMLESFRQHRLPELLAVGLLS